MSNIEFIPANELPTTESNEVDVLCVENGELKRKAGASIGGGKLFVLRFEDAYFSDGDFIFVDSKLFEEAQKQMNGESVFDALFVRYEDPYVVSERATEVRLPPIDGINAFLIGGVHTGAMVAKTTEDADALIAMMTQSTAEES